MSSGIYKKIYLEFLSAFSKVIEGQADILISILCVCSIPIQKQLKDKIKIHNLLEYKILRSAFDKYLPTLLKKIEDYLNKWKFIPCLWIGSLSNIHFSILPN